jgi:hypothetical protein
MGLPVIEHMDEEILYKLKKFQHHWGACSPFPLISGVLLLSLCTLVVMMEIKGGLLQLHLGFTTFPL